MGVPHNKNKSASLELYDSIDVLPLYNFDRYRATGDNNWLRRDFTGRETKVDQAIIKPTEEIINSEYYKLTDDRSFQMTLQLFAKINALETKFACVVSLIDTLRLGFPPDRRSQDSRAALIQLMKGWGFNMNLIATPLEDLQRLQEINEQLPGIRTQIRILEAEIKQKGKQATQSLHKQLLIVGISLGISYKIDPKATTVLEWVEMVKLMEEKAAKN